ncbi:serine/threonine-protein kinase [Paractinoplanes lichenicola]|uniref:Protein kinase n=1 Tax=Paractinoplanes lichenicola TaxID=2802976 RepID=A0ABS1VPA6_9ACTN|nr:serine/threonine-protein kinase [Actinoplanes lichenicola]MBL7255346.1 protein kinase [Actinoplanes lichenicola]
MPWTTGEVVLGQYEVTGESKAGGMGVVNRVRHLEWEVDLAVKTPLEPASFARFEAEAGTWVGLGLHPHTVNCVYVRRIDGVPRVFAEWVDGGSLAEAIRAGRLDEAGKVDIAIQTAWGLQHAHDNGLVHQDMKPANVMLEPDGTAKVTDFGLAVAASEGTFGGGTPAYFSPEQAAAAAGDRGVRLTPATDVWSWAITVAEMVAGRRFTRYGQAAAEALETVELAPEMHALLASCFAERPDGFGALIERLSSLYEALTGTRYPRPAPRPALLRSDGLSNQALSLLDLGRVDEAEMLWREAITADPHHLPSVYNFGLHRWRAGTVTGEEVVSGLEAARAAGGDPEPGRGALLLGSVELERHEDDRAGELLREAAAADPASAEAVAALRERATRAPGISAEAPAGEVRVMATGPGGEHVLFAVRGGGLHRWTPARGEPQRLADGAAVEALAVDGTGLLAAVLREDGSLTLWDVAEGVPRGWQRSVPGATSVALSGDGRFVAAGHGSGRIEVWEIGALGGPVVLTGHTDRITSLALSRTGRRVLSASFGGNITREEGDGTVRHWAVDTGECVAVWTGPRRGTLASGAPWVHFRGDKVVVSADARHAVAAWENGPLVVWDARRAAVVGEASHRLRYEIVLALAPGARGLLAGGPSRSARILDPRAGRSVRAFDDGLPELMLGVEAGAVSPDGSVVALGGPYQVVLRAMPGSGYRAPWCYARPRSAPELHRVQESFDDLIARARAGFDAGRFAEVAELLRAARELPGYDRHAEVLNGWRSLLPHGRRAGLIAAWETFSADGRDFFTQPPTAALRRDGLLLATGRWTGQVALLDVAEHRIAGNFAPGGKAREIRWARGGRLLVVLTWDGTLRLLDISDGGVEELTGETGAITAFDLDRAGERILYGEESGVLRLRGLETGVKLFSIRASDHPITAVALDPDDPRMACLDQRGEVRMWRPNTRRPDWKRRVPFWRETRLHFSPDRSTVLIDEMGLLTGVDAARGKKRFAFESRGPTGTSVGNVAFTPDRRLAATSDVRRLLVWETTTGKVRHELSLPEDPVHFALGPDGTFAVVAGLSDTVGIWATATGRCLRTLEGHQAGLHVIQLDDLGTAMVTVDIGGGLRAWELAWETDVD